MAVMADWFAILLSMAYLWLQRLAQCHEAFRVTLMTWMEGIQGMPRYLTHWLCRIGSRDSSVEHQISYVFCFEKKHVKGCQNARKQLVL